MDGLPTRYYVLEVSEQIDLQHVDERELGRGLAPIWGELRGDAVLCMDKRSSCRWLVG